MIGEGSKNTIRLSLDQVSYQVRESVELFVTWLVIVVYSVGQTFRR